MALSRKPLQRKAGNLKRTPLKRTTKMSKSRPVDCKYLLDRKAKTEEQWELFREIFKERGPYSEISGEYLGKEPKSWMFDHLLEKNKYPELRYNKENIILMTFEEHERKTNSFPDEKHQKLINEAKNKFEDDKTRK